MEMSWGNFLKGNKIILLVWGGVLVHASRVEQRLSDIQIIDAEHWIQASTEQQQGECNKMTSSIGCVIPIRPTRVGPDKAFGQMTLVEAPINRFSWRS